MNQSPASHGQPTVDSIGAPSHSAVMQPRSGMAAITPKPPVAGSRIMSVAGYRPERIVTNHEICQRIDSNDQWIRDRSGIAERRFAAADESIIDMAETVCRQAISDAELQPEDIDLILLGTITHLYQTPSAATLLAHRIGAPTAAATDISVACSGFCYGVGLADAAVRSGAARHVLVVGTEKMSDFLDLSDRGTAFIFGDGAGAAVIGPSDTPQIGPTRWGSDGSQWGIIISASSWLDFRDHNGPWPALTMAGPEVFRWAITALAPLLKQTVADAGLSMSDIEVFIPHQANIRIIDALAKQLGLAPDVTVVRDIAEVGNTSAASIPMAMARLLSEHPAAHGRLALLTGFGAGLTYAAHVVVLP